MSKTTRFPLLFAPKSVNDICAVISTFNPTEAIVENLRRISPQVSRVFLVDDSGSSEMSGRLSEWGKGVHNLVVVTQGANTGQARALNCGISRAKAEGYTWILTLDDDTSVEPDMVERLVDAWRRLASEGAKPVALIGMSYRDTGGPPGEDSSSDGEWACEKRGIITSGSLFPIAVFDYVGPLREEFFIDSVDYDFCLRARTAGARVIKLGQIGMTHSLGHLSSHRVGPFAVTTTNHSPLRRYYMYRNSLILAREYFFKDPLYAIAVVLFNLKTLLLVSLVEKDRAEKIKMMMAGTMDALLYRMGKSQR